MEWWEWCAVGAIISFVVCICAGVYAILNKVVDCDCVNCVRIRLQKAHKS